MTIHEFKPKERKTTGKVRDILLDALNDMDNEEIESVALVLVRPDGKTTSNYCLRQGAAFGPLIARLDNLKAWLHHEWDKP